MTYNGALFRIVPFGPAQVSAITLVNDVNAAFPAAALANIQPKVVTRSTTGASPRVLIIDIDLVADNLIDGLAALHTNLSGGASWQIFGRQSADGPHPAAGLEPAWSRLFLSGYTGFAITPTTLENRRFGLVTGALSLVRYVRVYLLEPTLSFIEIGTLLVLQRLDAGQDQFGNFELGSGRRVDDRSQIRALPGGETAIERGGRVPQWRASWSNLTEAQYRQLWSLLMEVGTGAPLLAAEYQDGSAGQAEALHYGLIQNIEFSERVQLGKQRIDLRVQELL